MTDANILFVDDEIGFVETMAKRLEKRNVTVIQAHDGEMAMHQLKTHPEIEVVVLGMKMPGQDGLSVLKEIKQDYPIVEVIMLTGHATVESAVEGMQFGAYDYLMKPCEIEVLSEKIRQAVQLMRQHEGEAVEARINEITHRQA